MDERKKKEIERLLREARPMSAADRQKQLVSMAYGNVKLENDRITRTMVESASLKGSR